MFFTFPLFLFPRLFLCTVSFFISIDRQLLNEDLSLQFIFQVLVLVIYLVKKIYQIFF